MISQTELAVFGKNWKRLGGRLSGKSSDQIVTLFDKAVGLSLAEMLGGIPVIKPSRTALTAAKECVEVGEVRIVGGVRPQNFDVGYRPDGVRFAFDSKSLNAAKSVKKNWQNMINDLATEATTVHSRFPHALVAFMVVIPTPCLAEPQRAAIIETLERLARRTSVADPDYMAEAISLVLWNPDDGHINAIAPVPESPLRIEKFSTTIESIYVSRYKGLPPHAVAE